MIVNIDFCELQIHIANCKMTIFASVNSYNARDDH